MALLDDLGIPPQPQATASKSSLLDDIGLKSTAAESTPSDTESFGDVLKNTGKHLAVGLGKLADMPGQIYDLAFHPGGDEPADIGTQVAKKIVGKPKNEGPVGRVVGAAEEAAPSAVLGGPEALLPNMASGATSQTAAEMGAGPTTQFIAGLTPFAPSALAGAARKIVRGGAEGAANMAENIQNAKQAGIDLSAGQLANNTPLRSSETVGSKLPGGGPLKDTRGMGLNKQIEESVSGIVNKLAPDTVHTPPTPTTAGEIIQPALRGRVQNLKNETAQVSDAMYEAGGGKDAPASAPKLEAAVAKVTNPTGIPEVDNLITKSKTKAVSKTVAGVAQQTRIPTSYSVDGNGAHTVGSPNGETHAIEDSSNNVKVVRSDTAPEAQGKGEGAARLEVLAHIATGKSKSLVSDISVSPSQAAAYEKLGRKGWNVQKNPNAMVSESTGNIISDSPKNPVYTVTAPKTQEVPGSGQIAVDPEKHFEGEWTYDPTTGKSEPTTSPQVSLTPNAQKPVLNPETPWTLGSLRQLRTDIGQNIGRSTGEAKRQLQTIYGAVSDDLRAHMASKGPEAEQAWDLFNHVASQNAATQKTLVKAVRDIGGPEAAFKAAISGNKDGVTKLQPIMSSLDENGQNLFRATVLHRLGRPGGSADAAFDANTFLTNWRAMSPEAKNMLFNTKTGWGAPGQLRTSLDSLEKTMDLLKKQGYIRSGLGKEAAGVQHTVMTGISALIAERAVEAGMHFAHGNHITGAATIAGAGGILAFNPVMSKVLTNPKTAAWLAQATKAPKGALPIMLNQLNQMGSQDPDAKDLYGLISESAK